MTKGLAFERLLWSENGNILERRRREDLPRLRALEFPNFARGPLCERFRFTRLGATSLRQQRVDRFFVQQLQHVGSERRTQVSATQGPSHNHHYSPFGQTPVRCFDQQTSDSNVKRIKPFNGVKYISTALSHDRTSLSTHPMRPQHAAITPSDTSSSAPTCSMNCVMCGTCGFTTAISAVTAKHKLQKGAHVT